MLRTGDVYTYDLKKDPWNVITPCYRPFILTEVKDDYVTAVTLTMHTHHYSNQRKIHTRMTVKGKTRDICILPDITFQIRPGDLKKKIAHVDHKTYSNILKMQENSSELVVINCCNFKEPQNGTDN